MQTFLERVEYLRAPAHSFRYRASPDWHDHELLKINRIVGMFAAVDDVHHWYRKHMRIHAANISI